MANKAEEPRSYVVQTDQGSVLRRNRQWLRKDSEVKKSQVEKKSLEAKFELLDQVTSSVMNKSKIPTLVQPPVVEGAVGSTTVVTGVPNQTLRRSSRQIEKTFRFREEF